MAVIVNLSAENITLPEVIAGFRGIRSTLDATSRKLAKPEIRSVADLEFPLWEMDNIRQAADLMNRLQNAMNRSAFPLAVPPDGRLHLILGILDRQGPNVRITDLEMYFHRVYPSEGFHPYFDSLRDAKYVAMKDSVRLVKLSITGKTVFGGSVKWVET